ncbi:MAG: hypothetical protein R3D25_11830 [Geminicoccaceae bacterium]
MLRFALVLVATILAGPAAAEPVPLSDAQMDRVAAGQLYVPNLSPRSIGTIHGISLNPDYRGTLQTIMFVGIGIIEALPIAAIVIGFESGRIGQP